MRAADTLERIAGVRPVGVRTPSWDFSQHTLAISREMGLLYDSSLMADDEPYELLEDGEPTGIVELPVEWIRDDAVYFYMDRFSSLRPYTPPSAVLEIFKREFDGAYRERGLFLLTMHPHIIGHRSRLPLVEELVEYMPRPRRRVVRDPRGGRTVLPRRRPDEADAPSTLSRRRLRRNPAAGGPASVPAAKCYRLVAISSTRSGGRAHGQGANQRED